MCMAKVVPACFPVWFACSTYQNHRYIEPVPKGAKQRIEPLKGLVPQQHHVEGVAVLRQSRPHALGIALVEEADLEHVRYPEAIRHAGISQPISEQQHCVAPGRERFEPVDVGPDPCPVLVEHVEQRLREAAYDVGGVEAEPVGDDWQLRGPCRLAWRQQMAEQRADDVAEARGAHDEGRSSPVAHCKQLVKAWAERDLRAPRGLLEQGRREGLGQEQCVRLMVPADRRA